MEPVLLDATTTPPQTRSAGRTKRLLYLTPATKRKRDEEDLRCAVENANESDKIRREEHRKKRYKEEDDRNKTPELCVSDPTADHFLEQLCDIYRDKAFEAEEAARKASHELAIKKAKEDADEEEKWEMQKAELRAGLIDDDNDHDEDSSSNSDEDPSWLVRDSSDSNMSEGDITPFPLLVARYRARAQAAEQLALREEEEEDDEEQFPFRAIADRQLQDEAEAFDLAMAQEDADDWENEYDELEEEESGEWDNENEEWDGNEE